MAGRQMRLEGSRSQGELTAVIFVLGRAVASFLEGLGTLSPLRSVQ